MKNKIKINTELLDKEKWYCLSCLKDGIITEFDKINKRFDCGHSGHSYRYQYCYDGRHWSGRMGISEKSICASCNISKNANAKEVCQKRMETIKNNGKLENCLNNLKLGHSTESRKLASDTMKKNGGYEKCIKAMNTAEAIKKEVETKRRLGVYDKIRHLEYCDKCGRETLHMHSVCLKCNPDSLGCINESNFSEKDGKLYYKDILWNEYKIKFKLNNINTDFNKYNGFWQKTYRIEENSTAGQDAMEQELVEKDIKWFVYIKFYMDKEKNIKPLIAGKSGSKLVNSSGSDLKFDIKDDTKPGRKFLLEENLNWYKDQIYIIPCKSENNAYILEKQILQEYNLFSS